MKKTLVLLALLLSCSIMEQDAKAQPLPPNTSLYTRGLLVLQNLASWQTALGIGGSNVIVTNVTFTTNTLLVLVTNYNVVFPATGYTNNNLYISTLSGNGDFLITGSVGSGVLAPTNFSFVYSFTNSLGVGVYTNNVFLTSTGLWAMSPVDFPVSTSVGLRVTNVANTSGQLLLNVYQEQSVTNGSASSLVVTNTIVPTNNGGTGVTYGRNAGASIGVLQMSPIGGTNYYGAMLANSPTFQGQLGLSYDAESTQGPVFLWDATTAGAAGTNSWARRPFALQGLEYVGNPVFADDFPSQIQVGNGSVDNLSTKFFYMYGTQASTKEAAYAYIASNYNTGNGIVQPAFNVIGGNPWSGAPLISVSTAFTNSTHGNFVGNNADGIPIYIPAFGWDIGQIGDAYQVGERNQAPGNMIGLGSDDTLFQYLSENSKRPADTLSGQVPELAIDVSRIQTRGNVSIMFPLQVPNVYSPTNPLWQNALMINTSNAPQALYGGGGMVYETNTSHYVSNLYVGGAVQSPDGTTYFNPTGRFDFGASSGVGHDDIANAPFAVNTAATFNFLPTGGAVTFDTLQSERFGIVQASGQYPMLAAGSGSPLQLAHSSVAQLQNGGSPGTQTMTVDMLLDGVNVIITNAEPLIVSGSFGTRKSNGSAPTTISVTGSPFTYTAASGFDQEVFIGSGIVTAVSVNGSSLATGLTFTGLTSIILQNGETVTVTYTSAPTMKWKPL